MVTTHHLCATCGSHHIRRTGSSQGHAKQQCPARRHQFRFVPVAARYAQVGKLVVERNSQCSIVRVTGVARMTVVKLLKKAWAALASFAAGKGPTPGMNGTRTGLDGDLCEPAAAQSLALPAVERARRHTVAWVLERRDAATALVLVAGFTPPLPAALLVLHGPNSGLRGRAAALAPPLLSEYHRSHQLPAAAALWRVGP